MQKRRFKAHASHDKGVTWSKARATGWPITDIVSKDPKATHGYVFALDIGDILVDVEVPERMLKLILRDVADKKLFDDNGGEQNGPNVR